MLDTTCLVCSETLADKLRLTFFSSLIPIHRYSLDRYRASLNIEPYILPDGIFHSAIVLCFRVVTDSFPHLTTVLNIIKFQIA